MKLDRIAFCNFHRAYQDAIRAPGNELAHARFSTWARLVSRIVGKPIAACATSEAVGGHQWVRATACALFVIIAANYAGGIWLNPTKPTNPAPPRIALAISVASTASVGIGSVYISNTMTGAQIRAFGPIMRPAVTQKST